MINIIPKGIIELNNVDYYKTSKSTEILGELSGTYVFWDDKVLCNRIRVAKEGAEEYIGWISVEGIATDSREDILENSGEVIEEEAPILTKVNAVSDCLCFTANTAGSTITLNKTGSPSWSGKYSTDGSTWTTYTPGTTGAITLSSVGSKVYFKGTYSDHNSTSKYLKFTMTGSIAASGNIMSFCSGDNFASVTAIPYNYMFHCLFEGCSALTTPPELPVTTLKPYCYSWLFKECTALTVAPELPATTLAERCYSNLLRNCTTITTPPLLPATKLAQSCYYTLFYGCTSLATAPVLPATDMAPQCYTYMFGRCNSLIIPPELPSMNLADSCYADMFCDCQSLLYAPKLPATTLAESCYLEMFRECPSITSMPALPATTLKHSCYWYMFDMCSGLDISETQTDYYKIPYRIPSAGTGTTAQDALEDMFGWTPDINTTYYIPGDYLCFTANTAGSTVALNKINNPYWVGCYSTDGTTWESYTPSVTGNITLANVGDKVYFKGLYSGHNERTIYLRFGMTGSIAASGNIMSFCSGNEYETATTIPYEYMFYSLFEGCSALTTPPELPATTLTNHCYHDMFRSCTALTTAPELPAMALAACCYSDMFIRCTSLTTAPELPATSLAISCYNTMFYNCTALTTAPTLPATTLASYCYSDMFRSCTALTTAPALTAITLAEGCYYQMFADCTSLTTAPILPATSLKNYCYYNMFSGCTSLTTAPILPATTLATSCYQGMFCACTSLTTPPLLNATTLAQSCYGNMFRNCTSLIISDTSGSGYTKTWKIPKSGTFTNTYSQSDMFYGCATGSGRASDAMAGAAGSSYKYYTQNSPIYGEAVTNTKSLLTICYDYYGNYDNLKQVLSDNGLSGIVAPIGTMIKLSEAPTPVPQLII